MESVSASSAGQSGSSGSTLWAFHSISPLHIWVTLQVIDFDSQIGLNTDSLAHLFSPESKESRVQDMQVVANKDTTQLLNFLTQ